MVLQNIGVNPAQANQMLALALQQSLITPEWVSKAAAELTPHTQRGEGGEKEAKEAIKGGKKEVKGVNKSGIKRPLDSTARSNGKIRKKDKAPKKPRTFDISSKLQRHISFRLAYDGETFQGFSQNVGVADDDSVEKILFEALVKCRLIEKREGCGYSRCGRTDKGVSAFGQIIALRVRSAYPPLSPAFKLPSNSTTEVPVEVMRVNKKTKEEETKTEMVKELDYIKMLNGVLPQELRVISWVPVTEEFSARFSCTSRTYRYFFPRRNLDLGKMRAGLDKIVGDHDFRNMAKMDTEHVSNFRRLIYSAKIIETMGGKGGKREGCYFEIKGQAFLWHMVRNIVQVIFFIGKGFEDPAIVDELFNVESLPGKPNYRMASDLPLVLHKCDFNNLEMLSSASNMWEVQCHLEKRWERFKVKCMQLENGIDSLSNEFVVNREETQNWARNKFLREKISFGEGAAEMTWGECLKVLDSEGIRPGVNNKEPEHKPLLQRGVGLTYEEKLGQMTGKKLERYEAARSKKKSDTVDKEFYRTKQAQGGVRDDKKK